MSEHSFDDLDQSSAEMNRDPRPFWAISEASDSELLKWLNGEIQFLKDDSSERVDQIKKAIANYKGIQYETQTARSRSSSDISQDNKAKVDKIVVNHLYDLTESHVSRAVKYKPAVEVSPANPEEFSDVVGAKMKKALIDHLWYKTKFREFLFPLLVRDSKVCGEDWLFVLWDAQAGDVHPAYASARRAGKSSITLEDGATVSLDRPVMQGDVVYRHVNAGDVFLQKKRCFDEVEYLFWQEIMNVDDLKADYPNLADQIKPEKDEQTYDYETLSLKKTANECVVYNFFHKKTGRLAGGKRVRFIKGLILENQELGLEHGRLPAVRLSDIDIPNERHGVSFFRNVRPLTNIYNNVTNMINRNQILCAHPKWVMPAGACKLEQLGNDITIVQFKGPVAPQLVSMSPTPRESFEFRQQIKEEFQILSGVHGVSRGEPPPGVTAGVAIQFLNEQENERANTFMLKVNSFIVDVADLTIQTASQFYKDSDERMISVAGKSHAWMARRFEQKWLEGDYDVRVANSSALPESKAQRVQNVLDLSERFPGIYSNEQVMEMLDLGQSEKMVDAATMAIRAAEAENEDIQAGEAVLPPAEYESHIAHWRVHARMFQNPNFKQLPREIQDSAKDHMMATEMMMFDLGRKNALFQSKVLAELDLFPMFYFDETMMPGPAGQLAAASAPPKAMVAPPPVGAGMPPGGGSPTPVTQSGQLEASAPPGAVPDVVQ